MQTLANLIDDFQAWRDNIPTWLAGSALADRLDEVLLLRDAVAPGWSFCPKDLGGT
jgi:hypothetical protein